VTTDLSAGRLAAADQARAYALVRWVRLVEAAGQLLDVADPTQVCMTLCGLLCQDWGVDPAPDDPATTAIAMLAAAAVREAELQRDAELHD
jgi:hypothetical protein